MKNFQYIIIFFNFLLMNVFCDSTFKNLIAQLSKDAIKQVIEQTKEKISPTCINRLEMIVNDGTNSYIAKSFRDSAKNKNDMGSFVDCMNIEYSNEKKNILKDMTYLIVTKKCKCIHGPTDVEYKFTEYIFGLCWINGCSAEDNIQVFLSVNKIFDNPFGILQSDQIKIYDILDTQSYLNYSFILQLFPILILLIFFIISCFNSLPIFLCRCCFKRKKEVFESITQITINKSEEKDDEIDGSFCIVKGGMSHRTSLVKKATMDTESIQRFKSCFSIKENFEELFEIDKYSSTNYGLQYIKGVRVLMMFLVTFGFMFVYLLSSPVKISSGRQLEEFIFSKSYIVIFIGLRYAPRFLFAISGFILIFKMLSYLEEKAQKYVTHEEETNITNTSDPLKNYSDIYFGTLLRPSKIMEISYSVLYRFIFLQTYKYIYYILFICLTKFSLYRFIMFIFETGPMWIYYNLNISKKIHIFGLIHSIFLTDSFSFSDSVKKINLFWIPMNEIAFFLFSAVLIFICFKKNLKMDRILWTIFLICQIIKIVFYFFSNNFYPTLYYYDEGYSLFLTTFIYNYPFFIIGMFLGKVNYVIQKSISGVSARNSDRKFLLNSVKFLRIFKYKKRSKIRTLILFTLLILFLFSSTILIYKRAYKKVTLQEIQENNIINLIFLFDTEIVIFLTLTCVVLLFSIGSNLIVKFSSNEYWTAISKSYFSFMLILNTLVVTVYYQSESRIKINFFNIFLLTSFTFVICFVLSMLLFIFFELPMKKLNRLILWKENENENDKYRDCINFK